MSTTLSRKFRVDVTTDLTLASGWLQLNGIDDWSPQINPNLEETSAYDTTGWKTNEVTMQDWTATASLFRRIVTSVYDPGQELIRATQGQFGTAARCGVRWYDKNGGPEAYSGVALPELNRANTGVSNVEKWSITFACTDIPLNINITNPFSVASVPVITSVTPSGLARLPLWRSSVSTSPAPSHDGRQVRWRQRDVLDRAERRPHHRRPAGRFGGFGPGHRHQRDRRVRGVPVHPDVVDGAGAAWLDRARPFASHPANPAPSQGRTSHASNEFGEITMSSTPNRSPP
jgi:hypothetical protein